MGRASGVVGVGLIVVGAVWILQGLNVLRGSFMSGRPTFSWLGLGLMAVGGVVLARARRGRNIDASRLPDGS